MTITGKESFLSAPVSEINLTVPGGLCTVNRRGKKLMAEYFLSKLRLSREHLCGGLKLCPQTQFYTTTRNIPFFPLKKKKGCLNKWLSVTVLTQEKAKCWQPNQSSSATGTSAACVAWFLGWTGGLCTSSNVGPALSVYLPDDVKRREQRKEKKKKKSEEKRRKGRRTHRSYCEPPLVSVPFSLTSTGPGLRNFSRRVSRFAFPLPRSSPFAGLNTS